MATDRLAPTAVPAPQAAGPDWTVQVADTIESVVGAVRDKTAVPLETVARALVYGILVGVMGITALALLTIGLVRLLVQIPGLPVWGADAALGGLFTLAGLFFWRKRRPTNKR